MPGRINGFSLAYTATGAIVMWSGIKGATISDTFKGLLKGQAPSPGGEAITSGTAAASSGSGITANASAGSDNANLNAIGKALYSSGAYSRAAAAGIAGCVAGESGGDPEAEGSGGRGLIGWTPPGTLPDAAFHGPNATAAQRTADLNAQIDQIAVYNNAQGAGLIKMLNAISDPVQASDFYSQHFERPLVTDSDVRAGVAESVFAYLGGQQSANQALTNNAAGG